MFETLAAPILLESLIISSAVTSPRYFQSLISLLSNLSIPGAVSIIGANRAGVFLHLMPVFGSLMAIIFFDEKFMTYHFLGAIFIILGITLSNKKIKNNA